MADIQEASVTATNFWKDGCTGYPRPPPQVKYPQVSFLRARSWSLFYKNVFHLKYFGSGHLDETNMNEAVGAAVTIEKAGYALKTFEK